MDDKDILYWVYDKNENLIGYIKQTTDKEQLTQCQERLAKADKFIYEIASRSYTIADISFCSECNEEWGYKHKDNCTVGKAQAFLGEKPWPTLTAKH